MSRRRTSVVMGLSVAFLISAGVWGLLMLRADATNRPRFERSADDGPLTPRQYGLAVAAAQRAVELDRAHVASATAVVKKGRLRDPNQSGLCRSGRLIEIRLTGRFPEISAHRAPWAPSGPVTSVQITVDGTSGRSCRLDLGVGRTAPYRHAADLLPALTE